MPRKPLCRVFHCSVNVVTHNTAEPRIDHRSWHSDRRAHTMGRKLNNGVEAEVGWIPLRYGVFHRAHHRKEYFSNPLGAAPVPPRIGRPLNVWKQCWPINYEERSVAYPDVVWMGKIPTYVLHDGGVILFRVIL